MIYKLHGTLQPYDWGGYEFIPKLLGQKPGAKPAAELWFGDHPAAPSLIEVDGQQLPLNEWLPDHAEEVLSPAARERFGDKLSFLLKILDVRKPLSIQVHPDKAQAEAGFAREEEANIPADKRNYVDRNHKPESMIALSDFWLLHGFAPLATIEERLQARPSLAPLLEILQKNGLEEAYRWALHASPEQLRQMLKPLLKKDPMRQILKTFLKKDTNPCGPVDATRATDPDYWLNRTVGALNLRPEALDPGLLCFYLFNIVALKPGEGIFQAARLPHAYLYGQNVELMAASNNVLRAGLTSKHVDKEELLRIVDCTPLTPAIIPAPPDRNLYVYPAPVADYRLESLTLAANVSSTWSNPEVTVLLNLSGYLKVSSDSTTLILNPGEVALIPDNMRIKLSTDNEPSQMVFANQPHLIKNVADFLNVLKKIRQPKKGKNKESITRFFRGHADENFKLIPSIYRDSSFIENEDKIIRNALINCPNDFAPSDTLFEKLVKLQHYGYPTRLLDLTSNPLVALYFAVNSHNDKDGEVIILDIPDLEIKYYDSDLVSILSAISLRKNFFPALDHVFSDINAKLSWEEDIKNINSIRSNIIKNKYKAAYIKQKTLEEFNNYPNINKLINDIRMDKPGFTSSISPDDFYKIICVQAKLNNPRIERQQGSFLLFGISEKGKMKPASITQDIEINRIVVPGKYKEDIRKELEILGISKRSLFPELADQAEFIKEKYRKK